MMAQLSDLTRPVVRAGTGFHRNDAPRLRCYETEKLRASDALAEQHMPGSIRSMQVEHVFRDVQTDRGSLLHGRLLRWQFDTATLAHRCRRGASTPSPIQLGFGFTLSGVGGLLGANRTVVLEELREGVRQHSLDAILFPKDIVQNASRFVADLARVFVIAEGHFVFGPMVRLGWGPGNIISLEAALVLEL